MMVMVCRCPGIEFWVVTTTPDTDAATDAAVVDFLGGVATVDVARIDPAGVHVNVAVVMPEQVRWRRTAADGIVYHAGSAVQQMVASGPGGQTVSGAHRPICHASRPVTVRSRIHEVRVHDACSWEGTARLSWSGCQRRWRSTLSAAINYYCRYSPARRQAHRTMHY